MNWEDFMRQARAGQGGGFEGFGGQGFGFDFEDLGLGDIFGEMFGFGGGGKKRRSKKGRDIEADIKISFQEAYSGVSREVEFYKTVKCSHCKGNGAEPGTPIKECPECDGAGQVAHMQRTILGAIRTYSVCPKCKGEGKTYKTACKECGGEGLVKKNIQTKVDIPAGIADGQTMRVSGEGEAGSSGGRAGDLYLNIRVKEDDNFQRNGDDIISQVIISPAQAALGTKINIKTIDGEGELKIPAGTQSGKIFKIGGKGMPHLEVGGKGDQLVEVIVKIPSSLSSKEKKLYQELAELNNDHVEKSGWFGVF
jgi:molecular chaperone DnaJ